jgi:hypothetical protein
VDRGGTKTYNPGSLEFRATYVSLLLFQGAYVWIKFREVAPKRVVYRRSRKDEFGRFQYYGKYEPRFKPPREKDVVTGTVLKLGRVPLGEYDTHQDAEVVCQIAGFYYGKDVGMVDMEDGSQVSIPALSEQERGLRGEEKRKWVSVKAKEVYKEFKKEKDVRRQPGSNTVSVNAGEQVDARDFSSAADQAVGFLTATANSDDEFVSVLSEPAEDRGPMMSFEPEILLNLDDFLGDFQEGFGGIPTLEESLNEQLNLQKEQLEAEFNRRIAEQHQQHLQIQQRLEEQNLELRQENEHMKSTLQQVLKPLRSHFVTEI